MIDDKTKRAIKLIDKQLEGEPVYTRPAPEDFRCFNCRSEPTCPSAWNLYNTGGDCLEEKLLRILTATVERIAHSIDVSLRDA